jgi:hypothetical protein
MQNEQMLNNTSRQLISGVRMREQKQFSAARRFAR